MFQAQNREINKDFRRRTVTGILAIFSLVAASVLVFAIAPGAVFAAGRAERSNHRINVPSAAAAKSAATAAFPLPCSERGQRVPLSSVGLQTRPFRMIAV